MQRAIAAMVMLAAALFATLALLRYHTFHNETFDLAFYARMAWGEAHFDGWNPIVSAHVRGLHLSWILAPLGLVGALFGQVPTLLLAQATALSATALPLARLARRKLGEAGSGVAAIAWLLHPNVSHVATNEFHPGSIAALPLALALEALDRRNARDVAIGVAGALACREDLAMVTALVGIAAWTLARRDPSEGARRLRGAGIAILFASIAYLAFFVLYLHPRFAPPQGSLELHFGRWGSSATEVITHLLTHPRDLLGHLAERHRILYLALISAPLALLPLLRPQWLLLGAPVLAMNLISEFPGTTDLDSHYLTPALPALVGAAIHAAAALPEWPLVRLAPLAASTILAHVALGGTPLSIAFPWSEHTDDARSRAALEILERIPSEASVQAPDALLPHLAERRTIARVPPPERNTDFVVLDLAHRSRFLHDEDLLRTTEEPIARAWLSRRDHALVHAAGDFVLLERGRDPREGVGARAIVGRADPGSGTALCACLGIAAARIERDGESETLVLELIARGPCDDDLALRIGTDWRPARVDLIAGGLLSPAHFERGDLVRSHHPLAPGEIPAGRLRVGALRSSGARPDPEDPMSVSVAISTQ